MVIQMLLWEVKAAYPDVVKCSLSLKSGRESQLGKVCYSQSSTEEVMMLLQYFILKKILSKLKET